MYDAQIINISWGNIYKTHEIYGYIWIAITCLTN